MKLTRTALAGLVFGVAAVAGGVLAAASSGSGPNVTTFSVDRLHVLDDGPVVQLPSVDGIEAVRQIVGDASLHEAASLPGVHTWVAEVADGSICIVAEDSGGYAATCGSMEMVAAGRVVLRVQNRASDPSLFVGVASNDVTAASVGGNDGLVDRNVWIVTAGPHDFRYEVRGPVGSVTVDMNSAG
jgi:hypothetical protein